MSVWVIIVNYRSAGLAIDCLRSLAPQVPDLCGGRVIVVDNASADGSVEALLGSVESEGWSSWVKVLPMDRNGGFAFGNNAGIRAALAAPNSPDYVLLLNPDTIVRPRAIRALVASMDTRPHAGIVGGRLESADGGVDCSAHRIHSPLSELDGGARLRLLSRMLERYVVSEPARSEAHPCDWVSGACLMVRREVLEEIGPMDEGFFLYFEEVDFCWRAKQAGWQVWYAPYARVLHLEGASTGIKRISRRAGYWYESRRRFFIKHYGVSGLLLADTFWGLGRLSFLLRRILGLGPGGNSQDPHWYGYDLLCGDLCAILSGRAWRVPRSGSL